MLNNPDYQTARSLLLAAVSAVEAERAALSECGGRILAEDVAAREHIPAFDRSPYDGFALRAADTAAATQSSPVTLRIVEEIPAGASPTRAITAHTAAKVLTGAPIPPGADAVVMYEKTRFTADSVTLVSPVQPGESIIRAGEDVRKGTLLARQGSTIDPGLAGMLAAQGIAAPAVYRRPRVALISTGSELVEADQLPPIGKIRNSSRSMLEAALGQLGCSAVYLGIAGDSAAEIAARIARGLADCDAVLTTGGVSAGDYDLTADAIEAAGGTLLFRGVDMKPGMACAYGTRNGKLICALSGNPASALTNFCAVALPALKKLSGRSQWIPEEIPMLLAEGFGKPSPKTRFLRGRLVLKDGQVRMEPSGAQGNIVLSSAIGCNAMAIIPAGSKGIEPGTVLKGFLL